MTALTEEQLRTYVASVEWTFAKTMADQPHEYTLRRGGDPVMFDRVAAHIKANGYVREYRGTPYTYLELDGYRYWAMGRTPFSEPFLINRARA